MVPLERRSERARRAKRVRRRDEKKPILSLNPLRRRRSEKPRNQRRRSRSEKRSRRRSRMILFPLTRQQILDSMILLMLELMEMPNLQTSLLHQPNLPNKLLHLPRQIRSALELLSFRLRSVLLLLQPLILSVLEPHLRLSLLPLTMDLADSSSPLKQQPLKLLLLVRLTSELSILRTQ